MKELKKSEDDWYEVVESRGGWRGMYRLGMEEIAETRQSQRQLESSSKQRQGV